MLYNNIDKIIASAMKQREREVLEVYKLIKSELTKAVKDGIEMNEANESKILLKMVSQREDAIKQYIEGGRQDLADKETFELNTINGLLPKQPTEEEISDYTSECIKAYCASKPDDYKLSMKDMKPLLTLVQEKYPSANGKIVSQTLKKII